MYYFSRSRKSPETEKAYGVLWLPLQQLLKRSDIVSLHLPADPGSYHMVNEDFLNTMRPGAFLVNTSRGAIVEDAALCRAIRSGHLAGAALDCYDPEPAEEDHPLVQLGRAYPDRLILCPHQGGISRSAFHQAHQMLFSDLRKLMAGERPDHIVNGL